MHYSTEDKMEFVGIRYILDLFKSQKATDPKKDDMQKLI